jgi:FMN phosphatase YigB (HAD superfamily)
MVSPNNNDSKPSPIDTSKISTLIFDIDDTLYDIGTGFTAHRNGEGAQSFMVAKLGFPDLQAAKEVRDVYFERYHATAKALIVAEEEGQFPYQQSNDDGQTAVSNKKLFDTKDLAQWWAERLDFTLLGGPNPKLVSMLESCPLNLVAFSNGPRMYVLRVLREIGLDHVFPPERVFAVDDVLPSCKPEKQAFEKVMAAVGVTDASQCIMVEDSMKNTRAAKELGMGTVLIAGNGRLRKNDAAAVVGDADDNTQALADAAEATKPGDAPDSTDTAVDVCIEIVDEMQTVLPGLWEN